MIMKSKVFKFFLAINLSLFSKQSFAQVDQGKIEPGVNDTELAIKQVEMNLKKLEVDYEINVRKLNMLLKWAEDGHYKLFIENSEYILMLSALLTVPTMLWSISKTSQAQKIFYKELTPLVNDLKRGQLNDDIFFNSKMLEYNEKSLSFEKQIKMGNVGYLLASIGLIITVILTAIPIYYSDEKKYLSSLKSMTTESELQSEFDRVKKELVSISAEIEKEQTTLKYLSIKAEVGKLF